MRRLVGSFICAGCAIVSAPPAVSAEPSTKIESPAVAVQRVPLYSTGLRDEAMMVIVGSVLIGIAAAVRRAA